MTPQELIAASGLNPAEFVTVAEASQISDQHPALLTGTYRGAPAVIRGWLIDSDEEAYTALAFVSKHPGYALEQLTHEEQERLRAEKDGAALNVTQEDVIDGVAEPVPYEPPAPALPAPELEAEIEDPREVSAVEPAECGGLKCFIINGAALHDGATCPDPNQP